MELRPVHVVDKRVVEKNDILVDELEDKDLDYVAVLERLLVFVVLDLHEFVCDFVEDKVG